MIDYPVEKAEFLTLYRSHLLRLQDVLQEGEQIEMPLIHDFAPGLYIRQIFMKKGTFVIGKTHKTEHFNIVLAGSAKVMIDGEVELIQAPDLFKSGAGVKKVLYILEDMIWATTHPTNETDLKVLEAQLILSSEEERELINAEVKKLL
jgi:quercetin dioxygenase-like cupin family protein